MNWFKEHTSSHSPCAREDSKKNHTRKSYWLGPVYGSLCLSVGGKIERWSGPDLIVRKDLDGVELIGFLLERTE